MLPHSASSLVRLNRLNDEHDALLDRLAVFRSGSVNGSRFDELVGLVRDCSEWAERANEFFGCELPPLDVESQSHGELRRALEAFLGTASH